MILRRIFGPLPLPRILAPLAVAVLVPAFAPAARGAPLHVAVATNFRSCCEEIAAAFTAQTAQPVTISSGATGQLCAQIRNGAPFDVFLAADAARPRDLEQRRLIVPGSRFTYARGRLALASTEVRFAAAADPCSLLAAGDYRRLAVASSELAPYGRAAIQALARLGLTDLTAPRLVTGQNVGQAMQYVASGNAELGLVAWSQVRGLARDRWCAWTIPDSLYAPIIQQAVLLPTGSRPGPARAFADYLQGPQARRLIEAHGYLLPPPHAEAADHAAP